jgi:hypothetical protein
MDPVHATIEEFAADGYTHGICTWSPGDTVRYGGQSDLR